MIFEVEYNEIKKVLSMLQNALTTSELNKIDTGFVQMNVIDDSVFFSHVGGEQLEYQFDLKTANAILNGSLSIAIKDLLDVMKSFKKESNVLLFERDDGELLIDDGVYEPEMILLSEENNPSEIFNLTKPQNFIELPLKWLSTRTELAKTNNRNTFLPSTSMIAFYLNKNNIQLRSFNLTNMFETTFELDHNFQDVVFLADKNTSSRLSRLLKSVKEDTVNIRWSHEEFYIFGENFVFRFTGMNDEHSKLIFDSLNFSGMCASELTAEVKKSDFLKIVNEKKHFKSESLGFTWSGMENEIDVKIDELDILPSESNKALYPYKTVQKTLSKWPTTELSIAEGSSDNQQPLILSCCDHHNKDSFILMPCMTGKKE